MLEYLIFYNCVFCVQHGLGNRSLTLRDINTIASFTFIEGESTQNFIQSLFITTIDVLGMLGYEKSLTEKMERELINELQRIIGEKGKVE